jgi:hypothetical protein
MNIDPVSYALLVPDQPQAPSLDLVNLLNQLRNACTTLWQSGTTAQRPADPVLGQMYFDTSLARPIFCDTIRVGGTPAHWTSL